MKEIKYKKSDGLRNRRLIVDEKKIEFRKGLAVVEAEVQTTKIELGFGNYRLGTNNYHCMGVINDNFEEAFNLELTNGVSAYLMFNEANKKIIRYGDFDFLVYSEYNNACEVNHIRLVNGFPVIMNKHLYPCISTSNERIVIANNTLYDISEAQFISPTFDQIKEDKDMPGVYTFIDKIMTNFNSQYRIIDYLVGKINKNGEIMCPVRSLNNGIIISSYTNYESLRLKQIERLKEKESIFNSNEIFEFFSNDAKLNLKKYNKQI